MPMLIEGVARAHGRAVENAILNGNSSAPSGLSDFAAEHVGGRRDISDGDVVTVTLLNMHEVDEVWPQPADVTYVVAQLAITICCRVMYLPDTG